MALISFAPFNEGVFKITSFIDIKDIVKTCKIHGDLRLHEIHKSANSIRCKYCRCEQRKKWRDANLEKHRKNVSDYKKNNRDAVNENYRYYYERKRDKYGVSYLGIQSKCRKVKITVDDYFRVVEEQQGLCAICSRPETRKKRKEDGEEVLSLCLDHDHKTGKFRALLCHACNTAIGKLEDNIDLLKSAIAYLEKHTSCRKITISST